MIERAIQLEELPVVVPRRLAAKFAAMSTRTLQNYEAPKGPLNPIKRNSRSVSYHRSELLKFLGIDEPTKAVSVPQRRRAKA